MSSNKSEQNLCKDELEVPAFLNKELFENVLKKCENSENLVVKNVKLTSAAPKADHYASIMFRANVEYEQEGVVHTKPMIIKTMPFVEGQKKEMLKESFIFETEIGMYTEALPKFQEILKSVGDDTVLAATVLYHSLEPYKIIIFEDLVPQGYELLRGGPLSVDEVRGAYAKLAKWHAVSYKLALEQPDYFDKYRHTFWTMPDVLKSGFLTDGIKLFMEMLHKQPTLSDYIPHFEAIQSDLLQNVANKFKEYRDNPQPNAYYVLSHGDFHSRNMMFKHNSSTDQFEDVMLLDFQISYMGAIVNDLTYSYYMLLSSEQRLNFDELIYFYFNVFLTTLKKIGFKGTQPKLIELRKQLLNNKSFDIFLMASFLPLWVAMQDGMDPDDMWSSLDCRRKLYENEKYIEELHTLLAKFLYLGYFDN